MLRGTIFVEHPDGSLERVVKTFDVTEAWAFQDKSEAWLAQNDGPGSPPYTVSYGPIAPPWH